MPALLPPARAFLHQPPQAGHPSRLCRGPGQLIVCGGRIWAAIDTRLVGLGWVCFLETANAGWCASCSQPVVFHDLTAISMVGSWSSRGKSWPWGWRGAVSCTGPWHLGSPPRALLS